MNKSLPDKWVRKALFTAINNIVVDGKTIKCYDYRTNNDHPEAYVLITTQSNEVVQSNKCEYRYESESLVEVFTSYPSSGNTGSRLLADNILDKVREVTDNLTLDVASGLTVIKQSESFPNDLMTPTNTLNVFRKFMRVRLLIN